MPASHSIGSVHMFTQTAVDFCQQSSIKALPKVASARSPFQRLLWSCALIFGLAVGSVNLTWLFHDYFSNEVTVSSQEILGKTHFPDITVWHQNPLTLGALSGYSFKHYKADLDILAEKYNKTVYEKYPWWFRQGIFRPFEANYLLNINDPEYQIALNKFMRHWVIDYWNRKAGNAIEGKMRYENSTLLYVTPLVHQRMGISYTLHLNETLGKLTNSFSILFYLYSFQHSFHEHAIDMLRSYIPMHSGNGVRLLIHEPNTLPDVESGGYGVPYGSEVTVLLDTLERVQLPSPYSNCNAQKYLHIDGISEAEYIYAKSACEALCKQMKIVKHCGCLNGGFVYTPSLKHKYPFCLKFDRENATRTFDKIVCTNDYLELNDDSIISQCELACPPSCHSIHYDMTVLQQPFPAETDQLSVYKEYIKDIDKMGHFKIYDEMLEELENSKNKTETSRKIYEKLQQTDLLSRNVLQLNVKLHSHKVKVLRDSPKVTAESLIGNLGGLLNLWVGITFVTVIEIIDFVYTKCTAEKAEKEKDKTTGEDVPMMGNNGDVRSNSESETAF